MAGKPGTILLTHNGKDREFEKAHAENLLKFQQGKGYSHWQIKDNKKYDYVDGKIVRKPSTPAPKKTEE